MSRTASFLGAALLAASLSACTTTPVADGPEEGKGQAAPGLCDSSMLGWTIGKTADAALVERAQRESGAKTVRVLRPGQVVTMEYSDTRLTIRVDENNKVTSANCG